MSAEVVAIASVGVAMLGVLVPLLLAHGRRMDALAGDLGALRADVAEVRRDLHAEATAIRADLHALAERVARIEGALTGPWRPANGAPAPAPAPVAEAAP